MDTIDTLLGITSGFLNNTTFQAILALTAGLGFVLLILTHPSTAGTPKDKKIELREWLGLTGSFVTERYRPMGRAIMVVAVLICGVLVASGVMAMIGLWQALWSIITAGPEHLATNESVRGYAFALAAIFGLPFLVWRSVVAQQQAVVAQKQADVSEQNHITDRISKAVEQLGAEKEVKAHMEDHLGTATQVTRTLPNIEVRIGGIYALERIAQDSLRDHIQIMEILCAYVQENAPVSGARKLSQPPSSPANDSAFDQKNWDVALSSWREQMDKELKAIKPRTDIQAVLKVIGRRSESQRRSEVKDTRHHSKGYRLDLRNSNLQGADLRRLHFERALFSNSRMERANIKGAKLHGAYLKGVNLQIANLREVGLKAANLSGASMQAANLTKTNMERAFLLDANLHGADITGGELNEAILINAEMHGTNLRETRLNAANFVNVKLNSSTALKASQCYYLAAKGLNLTNVKDLEQSQINQLFGDGSTQLAADKHRPTHWPDEVLRLDVFFEEWMDFRTDPKSYIPPHERTKT